MRSTLKKILFLAALVVPMGCGFFAIPFYGFQLSLYRLFTVLLLIGCFCQNKEIVLIRKSNKISVGFMFVWVLYSLFSFVWSVDHSNYFRLLFFILVGFVYIFIIQNIILVKSDYYSLIKFLEIGIIIQSIIGWYEIITKNYYFIPMNERNIVAYIESPDRVPIAMLGNPNDFATLMLLGAMIALFLYDISCTKNDRFFNLIVFISCVILLIQTKSRANLLGLLFSICFYIFFSDSKKIFTFLKFCIFLFLIPIAIYISSKYLNFNFAGKGSDGIRLGLIKSGFILLLNSFCFGVGLGQIEFYLKKGVGFYIGNIINMHNWWMEILTSCGIGIFVGYLLFYFNMFKDFFIAMRHSNILQERLFSKFVCCFMCGFIISSISSSQNMTSEYLWFLWAICIGYQGLFSFSK